MKILSKIAVFLSVLALFLTLPSSIFAKTTTSVPSNCSKPCPDGIGCCANKAPKPPTKPVKDVNYYLQAIWNEYHVRVVGSLNVDKLTSVYNTLSVLLSSPTYRRLLDVDNSPVTVKFGDPSTACGNNKAREEERTVYMGFCPMNIDYQNRFELTHELSHLVAEHNKSQNQQVMNQFYNNNYSFKHPLPTYNCMYDYTNNSYCLDSNSHQVCTPGTPGCNSKCRGPYPEECFADMVGEYLVYDVWRHLPWYPGGSYNFMQFPTQYSEYYNFSKTQLFDGKEFRFIAPTPTPFPCYSQYHGDCISKDRLSETDGKEVIPNVCGDSNLVCSTGKEKSKRLLTCNGTNYCLDIRGKKPATISHLCPGGTDNKRYSCRGGSVCCLGGPAIQQSIVPVVSPDPKQDQKNYNKQRPEGAESPYASTHRGGAAMRSNME